MAGTAKNPPLAVVLAECRAAMFANDAQRFTAEANRLLPEHKHIMGVDRLLNPKNSFSKALCLHIVAAQLESRLRSLDQNDPVTGRIVRAYARTWAAPLLEDFRFEPWRQPGRRADGTVAGGYTAFKGLKC